MKALLGDYERKRRRAMLHYDVVREAAERFAHVHHDPVEGEFDRDTCQYVFHLPIEPLDPEWTIRIGEFAYNTRASLDYLVTALVRSTGKQENESNEFPIYRLAKGKRWEQMPDWWDRADIIERKLKNTPPQTRAALKRLQPFYGIPLGNPHRHPLWALSTLNNRDKHRRLNLLARNASVDFVDADGKRIFHGPASFTRIEERQERDAYTVILRATPDYRERDVDMYLIPAYKVALDEPPELIGELAETLTSINQFIDSRVLPTVNALL